VHEVRRYPLGFSDDLYVEAPRQHLLQQYPDLHFGKTVTDTAMDTEAEGDVLATNQPGLSRSTLMAEPPNAPEEPLRRAVPDDAGGSERMAESGQRSFPSSFDTNILVR
jgi:hypothetical protein